MFGMLNLIRYEINKKVIQLLHTASDSCFRRLTFLIKNVELLDMEKNMKASLNA